MAECLLHQGLLKLDRPYPKPARSDILFPFCQQYQQCSCCNASHVVAIERSLQSPDSEVLSPGCSAMTAQLACSICDPDIGTSKRQQVCASTCQRWYSRCLNDYFSYSPFLQHLVPCGTRQASDICSQVAEMAEDGWDFCLQAGYKVTDAGSDASGVACFDGSKTDLSNFASCTAISQRLPIKVKPGSRFPLLYFMVLLSVATALVLVYRRITYIMTRRQLFKSTASSQRHFPGKSRTLRD